MAAALASTDALAEYGADAYNTNEMRDSGFQAEATTVLTNQINANSSIKGGICIGGVIFEFADEWHKDQSGDPNVHDTSGNAPGGGPHPDGTFNEEWWGLVDIDRTPREAFHAYADIKIPTP